MSKQNLGNGIHIEQNEIGYLLTCDEMTIEIDLEVASNLIEYLTGGIG